MAVRNRSTVDELPEPILLDLQARIGKGRWTYDQLLAWLRERGYSISRSAMGRYGKRFREVAQRLKESNEIKDALRAELGDAFEDDKLSELLVRIYQDLAFRRGMAVKDGEDIPVKDLHFACRAIKDLAAARKINADRILAVQRETAKKAADVGERVAVEESRKIGQQLPPEALKRIREEIYGIVERKAAP